MLEDHAASASGPWLGVDYGSRRIGLAILAHLSIAPRPLCTLANGAGGPDWRTLEKILAEWAPVACVVGLTAHADGTETTVTRATRRFAAALQERYGLPILWQDESLSSVTAEAHQRAMHRGRRQTRADLDPLAACEILRGFQSERCHP
ncbi:MAG: Holliday junction resolvase RuvX [Acidithiobacillus sp.]